MSSVVKAGMRAMMEGFANPGGSESYRTPVYEDALATFLAVVFIFVIILLFGVRLWNFSVVPLFEFARPANSAFQILGLTLFLCLIFPQV